MQVRILALQQLQRLFMALERRVETAVDEQVVGPQGQQKPSRHDGAENPALERTLRKDEGGGGGNGQGAGQRRVRRHEGDRLGPFTWHGQALLMGLGLAAAGLDRRDAGLACGRLARRLDALLGLQMALMVVALSRISMRVVNRAPVCRWTTPSTCRVRRAGS